MDENFFILTTLDRWKRHFREQNYIENYFYLLKVLKVLKLVSKSIKTRLGSPVAKPVINERDFIYLGFRKWFSL